MDNSRSRSRSRSKSRSRSRSRESHVVSPQHHAASIVNLAFEAMKTELAHRTSTWTCPSVKDMDGQRGWDIFFRLVQTFQQLTNKQFQEMEQKQMQTAMLITKNKDMFADYSYDMADGQPHVCSVCCLWRSGRDKQQDMVRRKGGIFEHIADQAFCGATPGLLDPCEDPCDIDSKYNEEFCRFCRNDNGSGVGCVCVMCAECEQEYHNCDCGANVGPCTECQKHLAKFKTQHPERVQQALRQACDECGYYQHASDCKIHILSRRDC